MKTERKQNLKRKQAAWKLQVQKAKKRKINPPNIAEEDDEKQPEFEEDENVQENLFESEIVSANNSGSGVAVVVDNGDDVAEKDDSFEFEDIFEPRRKVKEKVDQNQHLDDLEEFLEGFDDEELEGFL